MKKLIHYALHQPVFIVLGTLLFALAGIFALIFRHKSPTPTMIGVLTLACWL